MTDLDPELLDEFSQEIQGVRTDLEPVVKTLKATPSQTKAIEAFGQIIDRVYGTAATMGMKEFAEYCRTLKELSYKGSQVNNLYVHGQIAKIAETCLIHLAGLSNALKKPVELGKYTLLFRNEKDKAQSLIKTQLRTVTRSSVATKKVA